MLFHVFGHVETNQRLVAAKQEFRKAASNFCLADSSGPEEQKATDRTARSFQSGATSPNGASERGNRFILADDFLVQLGFDAQQFLLLIFLN